MKKLIPYLFLLVPFEAFSEGTKELRPQETDFGNLFLSKSANFTNFGQYGAPPERQIKIRVASVDETIYFGFNNRFQGGDFVAGMPYRIVSPSGVVVFESVTQAAGEGYIETYAQAVAGPSELGNAGGYDAIAIDAAEAGDYVLEFDVQAVASNTEIHLHLFDVTVAGPDNQAIPGRLHSQSWQLSTEGGTNPFSGVVYPYDNNGIVYEVDFNEMQPYSFVINFNSQGTGNTGDFLIDRQSKVGNHTFPEYEVFLNPPDENLYPTVDRSVTFSGEVIRTDCMRAQFCMSYTSNSEGFLEGFVDVNGNDVFDEGTDLPFHEFFETGSTRCIDWDGTDASGNLVDEREIRIFSSFGFGVTHLPLYDVEHNRNGYIVRVVRPTNVPDPLVFWDDANIGEGDALDGLENLSGCASQTQGCHRWEGRGNNNNPETINTWWYTRVLYDTLTIESFTENPVSLSFHPTGLVQGDTVICKGDSLQFYVYNDGKSHYDPTSYNYEWFMNGGSLSGSIRDQKLQINGPSEIVVKATDVNNAACFSFDTLHADIVEPVTISATVEDETCGEGNGSVSVTILTSPPDPVFTWQQFPGNTGSSINNLSGGTYNLHIEDPAYSTTCALDTSFEVGSTPPIEIESLLLTPTPCYEAEGEASVTMRDPATGPFEYNWDNGGFIAQSAVQGLAAGSHSLFVRNPVTGCTDDTTFDIEALPFSITVATEPEVCENSQGSITLTTPAADFDIIWNGTTTKNLSLTAIGAGNYTISVVSTFSSTCRVDTTVEVENLENPVVIEELVLQNIICGAPGSAEVIMPTDGRVYHFSWNGAGFSTGNSQTGLAEGNYTVRVIEAGTTCETDTAFTLTGTYPIEIKSLDLSPSECYAPTGSASVTMADPSGNYEYSWNGGAYITSASASQLDPGTYPVTVRDAVTGCTDDTTFDIPVLPLQIQFQAGPEVCGDGAGWIQVTTPPANFSFLLNGAARANPMQGLTAGFYSLEVVSTYSSSCRADTVAEVPADGESIRADLTLAPVICGAPTGSAQVSVPATGQTYQFAWNNGPYGSTRQISNLEKGTYTLSVIIPGSTCRLDTSFEITGSDPVEIVAVPAADTRCYEEAGSANVIMQDPAQPYVYNWDNQGFVTSPSISGLAAGQHSVLVRNPETGCQDDTTLQINPLPFTISFVKEDEYCSQGNGSVTLSVPAGNFTILWQGSPQTNTAIKGLSAGTYSFSVVSQLSSTCRVDSTVSLINDTYTVPADFTYVSTAYQQRMETGAVINFTNTSPGIISASSWDLGDGTLSSEHHPSHAYSLEGNYTVTLHVTDENGCTGSVAKVLAITEKTPCGMALPNAFTPNFDLTNDDIGVLGFAESVDLKIFNRWGEVVFRALETQERWDGTYRGQETPVGVYPYVLIYECPDENNRLIRITKVGDITLIR